MPIAQAAGRPPPPQNRPCATAALTPGSGLWASISQLSTSTFPAAEGRAAAARRF